MTFGDIQRQNLVAVGSVDDRQVRLWFRAQSPGRYLIEVTGPGNVNHGTAFVELAPGNTTDNTTTFVYPPPGGRRLDALTRYRFRISADDGTVFVGDGRFETAPAAPAQTPDHFGIGVLSCHQPFEQDGKLSPRNMRLLEGLPDYYARNDIKFLLTVGDQIYADTPGETSLLNPHYLSARWPGRGDLGSWTPEQIRAAYQERYRICWNQVPWLKLLASCPNYAILDDHEVFDDWGTSPALETAAHKRIIEAARLAYLDYQGGRQLAWHGDAVAAPPSFDYGFRYGTVATFVFDLRSERTVGPPTRVLSDAQLVRFQTFLAANKDAHVVLVVTSVPLVHIPEWVTSAGQWVLGNKVDFPDHWSAPQNRTDRNKILSILREHLSQPETQRQRLVVLGGDVHVGCAFCLRFVGGAKPHFYELTTSAVSNRLQGFNVEAGILGPHAFDFSPRMADGTLEVSLLPPAQGAPARNPIGGLNAGLVEFRRNGAETNVRLKLIGYDASHQVGDAFVSGWL